jgi:TRAP-type C4-dicarboxylate transport system permease small subunit
VEQHRRQDAEPESADALKRLQVIAERVSRGGAIVGGAMLLAAAVTIFVDIVLRYAFSLTVGGADDLAGYALAIASAWGFSSALLSRSHIRIDSVYVRVRRRARATLDLVSLAVFGLFVALVAWHASGVVAQSYVSGSRSLSAIEMPLVLPQSLWFAGLVFCVVVALLLLARALPAYVAGRLDKVFELIGSKSALAEAKEEIIAVERAIDSKQ